MAELVSVIIPAYNAEAYLAEAVQSILRQAYAPLEIIVANDGSQDGTARVASSFGDQVHYVFQPNAGVAAARNLGLQSASGSLLAFLDADDLWSDDKLTAQVKEMASKPALDAVFGHVQNFIEPELSGQPRMWQEKLPGYVPGAMLIRRSAMQRLGQFSTEWRLGEAIDFYIRFQEQGLQDVMLPDVVLYRRIHGENSGLTQKEHKNNNMLHILKSSLDRKRGKNN